MSLQEFIKPDGVLCNATARSKKHCLEILSELLTRAYIDVVSDDIFECLVERERLGCTSLNKGVAFPHCRASGIDETVGVLIKLSEPVDFDSPDGEPVDIVFGMMLPLEIEDRHRDDVRLVTELLADAKLRARLREMHTSKDLYDALIGGADLACKANCA
jgi:PTS system nitrogen regulatory IIA component